MRLGRRAPGIARLSCGVVPVRFDRDGNTWFLLLRAYAYWDFPKGRIEPGEEPLAAAIREFREETGLDNVTFPWGGEYFETAPYAGSGSRMKVARYYLGEVRGGGRVRLLVQPELGFPEHHEFRWVRYETAEKMLGPRVRQVLHWAGARLRKAGEMTGVPDRRSAG